MLNKDISYRRAINTTEVITLYLNNIIDFRFISQKLDSSASNVKSIFDIKSIGDLAVRVEAKRK